MLIYFAAEACEFEASSKYQILLILGKFLTFDLYKYMYFFEEILSIRD